MHGYPGRFITTEGPDGSGKSTSVPIIAEHLQSKGYSVTTTREPGGTKLGIKIRELIFNNPMSPMAEMLLFASDRAQHIEWLIKPTLEKGGVIISDRFSDSTYAYQGFGRNCGDKVETLRKFVHDGFEPDYTLFFDVTLEESAKRLGFRLNDDGEITRFDKEAVDFKRRVYEGYQECFRNNSHRMHRIDAMKDKEGVREGIIHWLDTVFIPNNPLECLHGR
jgi:dTMP kinase